jgi:triosephosphate isomerase (TIM)
MAKVRTPLVSGNWKMHHNHLEALHCTEKLHMRLSSEDFAKCDVSVHPPFTDLRTVQTFLAGEKRARILLGVQNCHPDEKGAFTGEVSVTMVAKLDVKFVIVGHSERRQLFGETDAGVNTKVKSVLKHQMTPIMCCGETLEEREAGEAEARVRAQIVAGLAGVKAEQVAAMVIAYEPIWAIGTGLTATADDAQNMCASIRSVVTETFGAETGLRIRIQYGGSVKPNNAAELLARPDIDGLLVGGASLDPDDFAKIVQAAPR